MGVRRAGTHGGCPATIHASMRVYVDGRDIVWLSDFGVNAIHAFDPETETFTIYPNSTEGANVRQINGRDREAWLPESGADRLVVIRPDAAG